jgi:hypothetical protein
LADLGQCRDIGISSIGAATLLATGFIAVHLEEAAFRTASVEPKFIVAISLNSVPRRIFEMVEPDITGPSLFARLLRIHAPKSPVLRTNTDALVNWDGLFFNVQFEIGVRKLPLAASTKEIGLRFASTGCCCFILRAKTI